MRAMTAEEEVVTASTCRLLSLFSLTFSAPPLRFYGLSISTDRGRLASLQRLARMAKCDNLGQVGGAGRRGRGGLRYFIGLAQCPLRKSTNQAAFHVSHTGRGRYKLFVYIYIYIYIYRERERERQRDRETERDRARFFFY